VVLTQPRTDWPDKCDRSPIIDGLNDLSTGDASSLLLQFADDQSSNLEKALEAPVCEFVRFEISLFAELLSISDTRNGRLALGS
jgi:hypothetical protein